MSDVWGLGTSTLPRMPKVLLVADRQSVIDHVLAALSGPDMTVIEHRDPETAAATAYEEAIDTVLVDMRVASMGAMAVTRAVRAAAKDADPIPVTILMDRDADHFNAGRSGADRWVPKTASASELRAAVTPAGADA